MFFESYFKIGNKKRIKFIITFSYILIVMVLYMSYIVSARHNALLWVEGDMQKRLDSFFWAMETDFNSKASDVNSIIESNSVIMPLSMDMKDQITDFLNTGLRKAKKSLGEIIVLSRDNQVIYNTAKSFGNTGGIPFSEKQYSCYIYNQGLYRAVYAPVYYRDDSTGKSMERVGTVIAVYDFMSFQSSISKCVEDGSYVIYGFTNGQLKFVIDQSKTSFPGNPVAPYAINKLKEGFTNLTIDGNNTLMLMKQIILPNSEHFIISLGISPDKYSSFEIKYILSSVVNCTFIVLIISIILMIVYFSLKYYIEKELHNRLEIQNLRVQKHDYSKHLNIVNGMAQSGEIAELKCYLESLCKKVVFESELAKLDSAPVNVLMQEKEYLAHEMGIKFGVDVRASLKNLRMEPADLCAVLSNLLDNAFEACDTGNSTCKYVNVEISYCENYHTFKIINTGCTIPNDILEKIFRPGYSTKLDKQGHGMGLYIVNKTLKKYKGCIEVESNDDVTSFTVFIPKI